MSIANNLIPFTVATFMGVTTMIYTFKPYLEEQRAKDLEKEKQAKAKAREAGFAVVPVAQAPQNGQLAQEVRDTQTISDELSIDTGATLSVGESTVTREWADFLRRSSPMGQGNGNGNGKPER